MLVVVSTLKIIIIIICFCKQIITYVELLSKLSLLDTTTKLNTTPWFATDDL